jgi:hypothetical protein
MEETNWWPIMALVMLVNPIVIVASLVCALIAKTWRHVLAALIMVPTAYWCYSALFGSVGRFAQLVPALALGGLAWTAAFFGLKAAWSR